MPQITLVLQSQVLVILGLTVVIFLGLMWIGKKLNAANPYEKPKGIVLGALMLVDSIDNMVKDNTGSSMVKPLGPYIGYLAIYILLANYIGLLGFDTPTSNYSVTLTLALITWVLIQKTAIKHSKLSGYIHGFFEPIFAFVIPNFFGRIAPLISMSLRLFGNLVAGTIIMSLLYAFTGYLSSMVIGWIPILGKFNFLATIITPVLHAYFDVFSGAIQMFIFIMLTMCLIGNEIPEESK